VAETTAAPALGDAERAAVDHAAQLRFATGRLLALCDGVVQPPKHRISNSYARSCAESWRETIRTLLLPLARAADAARGTCCGPARSAGSGSTPRTPTNRTAATRARRVTSPP
jgi:hypothetical protein